MSKNSIWVIIGRESSNDKNKEIPLLRIHESLGGRNKNVERFTIFIRRANNEHRYSVDRERREIFITGSIDEDTRGYVMLQQIATKKWLYCEGVCISMREGQPEKTTRDTQGEIIFDSSNILDRILEGPQPLLYLV